MVRERSDYLEKLIESKDEVMEERISGYRLRYGKVPDWGFEFLEKQKKPKVEDGSNLQDVNKSNKKKGLGLKLKTKFNDSDDEDKENGTMRDIRARTDKFLSIPKDFGKKKETKFNWGEEEDIFGSSAINIKGKGLKLSLNTKAFNSSTKASKNECYSVPQHVAKLKGPQFNWVHEEQDENSEDDYDFSGPMAKKNNPVAVGLGNKKAMGKFYFDEKDEDMLDEYGMDDSDAKVDAEKGLFTKKKSDNISSDEEEEFFNKKNKISFPTQNKPIAKKEATKPKRNAFDNFEENTYVDPSFAKAMGKKDSLSQEESKAKFISKTVDTIQKQKAREKSCKADDEEFGDFNGFNTTNDKKKIKLKLLSK